MEKNKVNYIVYVLLFCVVIAGIGGFYLGKSFGEKTIVEKESDKPSDVDKKEDEKKEEVDEVSKELLDIIGMTSFRDETAYVGNSKNDIVRYYLNEDSPYWMILSYGYNYDMINDVNDKNLCKDDSGIELTGCQFISEENLDKIYSVYNIKESKEEVFKRKVDNGYVFFTAGDSIDGKIKHNIVRKTYSKKEILIDNELIYDEVGKLILKQEIEYTFAKRGSGNYYLESVKLIEATN